MTNSNKIRHAATAREIRSLVHFTPAVNARSILSNGLASRPLLEENNIPYLGTDSWLEGEDLNAISLSIEQINYQMFRAKKKIYDGPWVIFALDPSILWTHNCRFCWTNSASREIKDHRGYLGGPWGYDRMFDSQPVNLADKRCQREVYGLLESTPTDNAAEVQVFEPIDSDLIAAAGVLTVSDKAELEALMTELDHERPIQVGKDLFGI